MRLKDKVVVVTGSTSGIGKAIARRCVDEGARVLVHGLEPDLGEEVVASSGQPAKLRHGDACSATEGRRVERPAGPLHSPRGLSAGRHRAGAGGLHRQSERIPCNMCQFLDFIALIIMGQDQSITLVSQAEDFFYDIVLIHDTTISLLKDCRILV